jgi:hypothetical protein
MFATVDALGAGEGVVVRLFGQNIEFPRRFEPFY